MCHLSDQVSNLPLLGGKFCILKTPFLINLSFFIKPMTFLLILYDDSVAIKLWNCYYYATKIRDEKTHIFGEYLHRKNLQFQHKFLTTIQQPSAKQFIFFLLTENDRQKQWFCHPNCGGYREKANITCLSPFSRSKNTKLFVRTSSLMLPL